MSKKFEFVSPCNEQRVIPLTDLSVEVNKGVFCVEEKTPDPDSDYILVCNTSRVVPGNPTCFVGFTVVSKTTRQSVTPVAIYEVMYNGEEYRLVYPQIGYLDYFKHYDQKYLESGQQHQPMIIYPNNTSSSMDQIVGFLSLNYQLILKIVEPLCNCTPVESKAIH